MFSSPRACFFLFLAGVLARSPPLVSLRNQGLIVGREVTVTRFQKSASFLGIPFAASPVDSLRFAPPKTKPLPSWDITYNGTYFRPACLQTEELWQETHPLFEVIGMEMPEFDEDCLYLNVFVPEWTGLPITELLPVMVWIHPGDFQSGAASPWDGTFLANKNKVVVVTISYRLNVFGFLTIKSDYSPANLGLLDQIAALEWVRANIDVFGGNNSSVTIFGQGAGAVSVGLHTLYTQAVSLFDRAIVMSGNALITGAVRPHRPLIEQASRLGVIYGCSEGGLLQCLRVSNAKNLLNEALQVGSWGPVVDVTLVNDTQIPYLYDTPIKLFDDGRFAKVDLMIGFNDMNSITTKKEIEQLEKEMTINDFKQFIQEILLDELPATENNDSCILTNQHVVDTVWFYYTPQPPSNDPSILRQRFIDFRTEMRYAASTLRQAEYFSRFRPPYVYRFDYKAKKLGLADWTKVTDQFELPYIWGMPFWSNLTTIPWSSNDKKFSENVMSLWANFARTGNASFANIRWDKYTIDNPWILKMDKNFNISDTSTLDYKAFTFWNQYFPQVLEALQDCCNSTSSASSLLIFNDFNYLLIYLFSYIFLYFSILTLYECDFYFSSEKITFTQSDYTY